MTNNFLEGEPENTENKHWDLLVKAFATLAHDLIESGEADEILNDTLSKS